jgi:hypothetical protein
VTLELRGTEELTIEIEGRLPIARAGELVPDLLDLETDGDDAVVSLLVFAMRGLRPRGMPLFGLDYGEALWRVGVRLKDDLSWFGVACDLDNRIVGTLGRWLVRYPVRRASFRFDGESVAIARGEHAMHLAATGGADAPRPEAVAPRPLLVWETSRLFRIPWQEEPAADRREVPIEVREAGLVGGTFGAVRWQPRGLVHRGRIHRCGLAQDVRVTAWTTARQSR